MHGCLSLAGVVCVVMYRRQLRADHSSREVPPNAVSLMQCDFETSTMKRPICNRAIKS